MMDEIAKNLYGLKLHETLATPCFLVHRVPGGWLYERRWDDSGISNPYTVFVRFDNEYQRR